MWAWLLLLAPLGWLAWAIYQRTRPGVTAPVRHALWALRALALGILVLLLAEPLATYLARRALRPLTVTLVDTSASMAVEEAGVTRLGRVREALAGDLGQYLGPGPMRSFAQTCLVLEPEDLGGLTAEGQATDLAAALTAAAEAVEDRRLLAGVVLLSDGRHNLGEDPEAIASDLGVPVYALHVGSQDSTSDLQIVGVDTPDPVFAGQSLEMKVSLRGWGYAGRGVEVTLAEEDRILASATTTVAADGQVAAAAVRLPTLEAGPHVLRIAVTELDGEVSVRNNHSLVFLRVRQSRLRVRLVASRPGAEAAFLARTLRADSTLAITARIRRDEDGYYDGEAAFDGLSTQDVLILVDPDDDLLDAAAVQQIEAFLRAGHGLLVVAGPQATATWPDASPLTDLLPMTIPGAGRLLPPDGPLQRAPGAAGHPLGRSLMPRTSQPSQDPWQSLPPLAGRLSGARLAAGATALLTTRDGVPVVAAGAVGPGRVVAAIGSGFWRLDLLAAGVGESAQVSRTFWRTATRWLALSTPTGRVRSSPEQPVYRAGEAAAVAAGVFDELSEPFDGARVTISLTPPGSSSAMSTMGAGRYRASWTGLAPGDYTYTVEAEHGGARLGRSEGRFVVESHSVEDADLRADPGMLARIARASGGDVRPLARWRELAERLRPPPRLIREEHRLAMEIDQIVWLVLLVVLLSAEWLIRKRSGML